MENIQKKQQFHSLASLRFLAFLKVCLFHIPVQGDFFLYSFLRKGGGIGVSFFFVLSGFLITYLLVFNKLHVGKVDIKSFLLRRSLRIWPLYYLCVAVVFLLPYDFKQSIGWHMVGGGYDLDWRFTLTFLENYKMMLLDNYPKTTPLSVFWSLCVEVQFYIIWVFVIAWIPRNRILFFLFMSFIIAWCTRYFEPIIYHNQYMDTCGVFTNLDYFASGGILGFFVAKDYQKFSDFIQRQNKYLKMTILFLSILMVIFQKELLPYEVSTIFFVFRSSIIGLVFMCMLALFLPQESKFRIDNKWLAYLGERSYGLYVFHIIFVHVLFQYCINHSIKIDNWGTLLLFIVFTLVGSIVTSILSYRYFEQFFLNFGKK